MFDRNSLEKIAPSINTIKTIKSCTTIKDFILRNIKISFSKTGIFVDFWHETKFQLFSIVSKKNVFSSFKICKATEMTTLFLPCPMCAKGHHHLFKGREKLTFFGNSLAWPMTSFDPFSSWHQRLKLFASSAVNELSKFSDRASFRIAQ